MAHSHNKAPRASGDRGSQPWFNAAKAKSDRKRKAAKAARRKNRR